MWQVSEESLFIGVLGEAVFEVLDLGDDEL
jgi:hypothetical protein